MTPTQLALQQAHKARLARMNAPAAERMEIEELRARVRELENQNMMLRRIEADGLRFPYKWGLTGVQSKMLKALLEHPSGFCTHAELRACVKWAHSENIVPTHIRGMRKKLSCLGVEIITRHRQGYQLSESSRAKIIKELGI